MHALLANGHCIVPEAVFANTGLQRAAALSLFFALLDKHPNGLNFVIMDDPILSLDDSHREAWSLKILKPRMRDYQLIIATHQEHYITNCRRHFEDEGQSIVEINPRRRKSTLTWRPGKRLDRAEEVLNRAPANAPTEMRKYREELLSTLDAYCPTAFYSKNWAESLDRYSKFKPPHPLAGSAQRKICDTLKKNEVTTVLDPGSHHLTEADVTPEMMKLCLEELRKREGVIKTEFENLERHRKHENRQTSIPTSLTTFKTLPDSSNWINKVSFNTIGSAAAKGDLWEINSAGQVTNIQIDPGSVVLLTENVLDPVAKAHQWLLLANEEIVPKDGDLVAVSCSNGDQLCRRLTSLRNEWVLQAINPTEFFPDFVTSKTDASVRKVIGVIYEQDEQHQNPADDKRIEWFENSNFNISVFDELNCVEVQGVSLDPIARDGQHVLIDNSKAGSLNDVRDGDIAVIDSQISGIGRVIKRVHHHNGGCLLLSPNPVAPHPPLEIKAEQINEARFWIVRGVLFDSVEYEG